MQLIQLNANPKLIPLSQKRKESLMSNSQKVNELILFNHSQIAINTDTITHIVFIKDISHLKADGNYTTIYLSDSSHILTSKTLKYWESKINSTYFFRPHNSTLVNRFEVAIIDTFQSLIELKNGLSVQISRRMKQKVKEHF